MIPTPVLSPTHPSTLSRPMTFVRSSVREAARLGVLVGLVLVVGWPGALPSLATAGDFTEVDSFQAMKEEWQDRYRALLQDAARLRHNANSARDNYRMAQRWNYPRGGARQKFLLQADEAERDLVRVESDLEKFRVDARRAGALPGWLYEVEEEERVVSEPAAPADASDPDLEGRNPLYLEQDEDER